MIRHKLLLVLVLLISLNSSHFGQSLKPSIEKLKSAFATSDMDLFMSMYADTVHYIDPLWGSDEYYTKPTIKSFFARSFKKKGEPSLFTIETVATAEDKGIIMFKGLIFNQKEQKDFPFVIHMKLSNGVIVEQTDFPVYPLSILRYSPRLKDHLKPKSTRGK